MKKSNVLLGLFAIAALSITSCSDDDSNGNGGSIAGTYDLEEVNIANPIDFDEDGDTNRDLTEESDCYDSGKIKLNADNTMTYTYSRVTIDEALGTDDCASNTFNGTWELQGQTGSTTFITATYTDENNDNVPIQLVKQGNELTYTPLIGQYPTRNNDGGAEYATGSVEYVFKK
ncbi:DUF5004 domain-containing protein [Flavobacterium selenitireducens]|uniref:DUF5004 domain-containing protein n=1 Tax=Flavobacterium selenitireducens TaxID=2722704 RepID=UPI00168AF984|nr:lipocalin family protein [Flavobacterium selenitireducens]MBD3583711.1 hypothetical protein [Flavobacterium selenitireducens]